MNQSIWMVISISLAVGVAAGFFMHRSDYCLAGAFRDLFLFRSVNRLGSIVFLIAISAFFFESLRLAGWLSAYPFPWFATPSFSNVIGGVLFGIGMVMAGGCVVGVLYKFGAGNVLAGVAIAGLIIGSGLYAELHPFWSPLANGMKLHTDAVTVPQLVKASPVWFSAVIILLGGVFSWHWWRTCQPRIKNPSEGYIPLWLTALALAVLGVVSVLTTTIPMGVSTSYAKAAAVLESLVSSGHVEQTAFFAARKAQLTFPFDSQPLFGGGGPQLDVIAIVQYPLILGIICGALLSAKLLGEFRLYWQVPRRQFLMVLSGGIVMALGARMAPGCNVWHLLGGLPILVLQSILFVAGMLPGAWLGTIILKRVLA